MKKLLIVILTLAMIFALSACTVPAMSNPDGSDTVAGTAIKTGLNVVEAACVMLLSAAAATYAKAGKKNKYLQNISIAVENALKMARVTVGELKQTTVGKMKELNGGKLTPADIEELKSALLEKTLEKMNEPAKELLAAAGVDICALIAGVGEDWVGALKAEDGVLIGAELSVPLPRAEQEE